MSAKPAFTLLETLMAMAIISLTVTASLTAGRLIQQSAYRSQNSSRMNSLALAGLDEMRMYRDMNAAASNSLEATFLSQGISLGASATMGYLRSTPNPNPHYTWQNGSTSLPIDGNTYIWQLTIFENSALHYYFVNSNVTDQTVGTQVSKTMVLTDWSL